MPRLKPGQRAECLARGEVRIVGVSDAPQQWPVGAIKGGKSPVLYGSLVRAVKQEQAKDVAKAWGVGASTVNKWRRTLGVEKSTAGYRQRMKAYYRTPAGKRALKPMHAKARDPGRRAKIAAAKLGKPRPRWIIEAMAKARTGMKHSAASRAKMSATHKARGTRPPWLNPAWSAREDRIVRSKPPAEAARLTGRTLSAVRNRRNKLRRER
jgi:transposase-like protein